MKPHVFLAAALAAAALLPTALADASVPAAGGDAAPGDADDGYYDLEAMSDVDLEEICTARGFDLVRDADAEYTHADYVEAATECLQIDADLEEILRTHPEIMGDVQRERERMEGARDALRAQLEQQQRAGSREQRHSETAVDEREEERNALPNNETATSSDAVGSGDPPGKGDRETASFEDRDGAASPKRDAASSGATGSRVLPEHKESFDLKVITREVLEQMQADFRACANFLLPPRRREQLRSLFRRKLQPALAPCAAVAKGMCREVYEMARRQWTAAGRRIAEDIQRKRERLEGARDALRARRRGAGGPEAREARAAPPGAAA